MAVLAACSSVGPQQLTLNFESIPPGQNTPNYTVELANLVLVDVTLQREGIYLDSFLGNFDQNQIDLLPQDIPASGTELIILARDADRVASWAMTGPLDFADDTTRAAYFTPRSAAVAYPLEQAVISIDGQCNDWTQPTSVWLTGLDDRVEALREVESAADLNAQLLFGWSADYLYVAARVADSQVVVDDGAGDVDDDTLEIGFDGDNGANLNFDNADDFKYRIDANGGVTELFAAPTLAVGDVAAARLPGDLGYCIEFRIPLAALSAQLPPPNDTQVIGIGATIYDDDGAGVDKALQFLPNNDTPDTFGDLVFPE